jgi:hypothetical protein
MSRISMAELIKLQKALKTNEAIGKKLHQGEIAAY